MSARDTERNRQAGPAEEEGSFLARWSRRKEAAAAGAPLPEPASAQVVTPDASITADPVVPDEPLPDPALLTISDDFTPFLKARVAPELKKAAMKKLFADPGFNEIDGLDVYLDDFNLIPDLPASDLAMLRHAKEVLWPGSGEEEGDTGADAVAQGETDGNGQDAPAAPAHEEAKPGASSGDALRAVAPAADELDVAPVEGSGKWPLEH